MDQPLILALLSDYDANTLTTELPSIREQLGILEASLVPDLDETLPTEPESTDELADSVSSIVLDRDGPSVPGILNIKPPSTTTSTSGSGPKSKKKGKAQKNGNGNAKNKSKGHGNGIGSWALSGTASTSDSGWLESRSVDSNQSRGHEEDESGSGSGSAGAEVQGLAGELELLQNLFPNLYVHSHLPSPA